MNVQYMMPFAFAAAPILVLLMSGTWIAARSGVDQISTGKDVIKLAGNVSGVLLRVAGYVVILLIVQHFIGLRSTFGW